MEASSYITALAFFATAGILTWVEINPVGGAVVILFGLGLLLGMQGICNAIHSTKQSTTTPKK